MKNKNIKKVMCGLLVGGLFATNMALISAETFEGSSSQSKILTIGNVDVPVYSYTIDNLNYIGNADWLYDETTKTYDWYTNSCKEYTYDETTVESSKVTLWGDSSCSKTTTWDAVKNSESKKYYVDLSYLYLTDTSERGKINATLSYVPETDYEWTSGEFTFDNYVCKQDSVDLDTISTIGMNLNNYYQDSTCENSYDIDYTDTSKYYTLQYDPTTQNIYSYQYQQVEYVISDSGSDAYIDGTFAGANTLTEVEIPFQEKDILHISNNGMTGLTTGVRQAVISFDLIENTDEHDSPVAGDTIGTITINITES